MENVIDDETQMFLWFQQSKVPKTDYQLNCGLLSRHLRDAFFCLIGNYLGKNGLFVSLLHSSCCFDKNGSAHDMLYNIIALSFFQTH